MQKRYSTLLMLIALVTVLFSSMIKPQLLRAQAPKSLAVMASAEVTETPAPSITLKWNASAGQRNVQIFRKAKDAATWPSAPVAQLDSVATTWKDVDVQVGVAYEYRLFREVIERAGTDTTTGNPIYRRFMATGYLLSGIKAAPAPRGRVLVLVDTTMVSPLRTHLDTLRNDLENDGWVVDMRAVERAETYDGAAVNRVRNLIRSVVQEHRRDLRSIFIVGRVPVPYAGNIAPDGHVPDHQGAWPADGIYGDDNGQYSDASVNVNNTSRPVNANVSGDGKFDQSIFPGTVETAVGRVDFFDMPAFSASEVDLLKAYFIKNHAFRAGRIETIKGGIVDDNFGSYGEWFAACAWRSFATIGRDTAIKAADWFESLAGPRTYLYAYGCGGGTNTSAGGVGTTADFTTKPVYAVHTELFGSYFGDWNTRDNFLRAPLASSPYALTCGWAGRPAWYTHHMSLGESIGYSFLLTQNNATIVGGQLGRYTPHVIYNAQGAGSLASIGDRGVHIALMGDPTLRAVMQPVSAMGKVTAATEYPNKVNLSWQRPGNDIEAYMIYRKYDEFAGWELLTPKAITALSFQDSLINEGNVEYRVHACALRQTASGTYYDMGKFAYATIPTTGVTEDLTSPIGSLVLTPNPASGDVAIEVFVSREGPLTLTITDLTGRTVWSIRYDQVNAGSFTVRPDAMITSQMSAGRYVVSMSGATGVVSQLLTIRR